MTHQQPAIVMIDGRIVRSQEAVVSVFDRGFLYGDSVFEVMRNYNRQPFALSEHVDRLCLSAARVYIDVPVSKAQLAAEVHQAVAASSHADSSVRIHVTRGSGPLGLDPLPATDPVRVIMVVPLVAPPSEDYQNGVGVALYRTERAVDNTEAAGAKVANYLVSLLALRSAKADGAAEAIIVDGRGRVLEGASSNIFVVKDGCVLTPPDSEGILPGITRQYLLRAAESLDIPLRITTLTKGDLMSADEVFISSTIRELLPVARVDGEPIGSGAVGPLSRAIHIRFRQLGALPGPAPWETTAEHP